MIASTLRYGFEVTTAGGTLAWDSAGVLPTLLEDSRQEEERAEARRRPLADGETVDPNRAPEETLDRLPGVGAGLAKAIVDERETGGGFAAPEDLLRVKGVGKATLERIRVHIDLSRGVPSGLLRTRSAHWSSLIGKLGHAETETPVDLNRADSTALLGLPGIGPALAGRIIEDRRSGGRFRTVDDLSRVRGIGPATVDRLRSLVRVGGVGVP